ncbi:EbsA family protein [Enterococcus camelliae]|uniref:EbsA family protein n=1 Tax=Enterococcus camelliae TaxID=453959 RepID=A0ABW5TI55_9ENTE
MSSQKKFHWQPETATSLIFWSFAFFLFFFSLVMALENTRPYPASIGLTIFSLLFMCIGWNRKIILEKNHLRIIYARFWKKKDLPLTSIVTIQQVSNHVSIRLENEAFLCKMSKKTRTRFFEEWEKIENGRS